MIITIDFVQQLQHPTNKKQVFLKTIQDFRKNWTEHRFEKVRCCHKMISQMSNIWLLACWIKPLARRLVTLQVYKSMIGRIILELCTKISELIGCEPQELSTYGQNIKIYSLKKYPTCFCPDGLKYSRIEESLKLNHNYSVN